jgi:hypothetical protein
MKAFPFNFIGELVFYHSDENDLTGIDDRVLNAVGGNLNADKSLTISGGPFILPTNLQIRIKIDPIVMHIVYSINLMALNALWLVITLFALMTGYFHYTRTAWIIGLLATAGYFALIMLQYGYIERKITTGLNLPPFEGEIALWHKQKKWLQQPEVCPACGEKRNIYSDKCISCGLKLPPTDSQKRLDNSASSTADIMYNFDLKK